MNDSTRPYSEKQLQDQVISLVESARLKLANNLSEEGIKKCFQLEVYSGELPVGKDGAYVEDQSRIVISSLVTSIQRRQFTLFHELVHYLLRTDDPLYSYLHDAFQNDDDFDKTIERLCNLGAAEFLLPREVVRASIDSKGFSLNLLLELCKQTNASAPAALIQLVQNAPHRCFGVVCEYGQSQSAITPNQRTFVQANLQNHLYILYAMWSPSITDLSLARWTIIPSNHLLIQAFNTQTYLEGNDNIPFKSGKEWSVPCQALFFRNMVYGIFNVTNPPNQHQLRMF